MAYVYEEFLKIADKLKTSVPNSQENHDDNLNNGEDDIEELMSLLDDEDIMEVKDFIEQKGKNK